MTVVFNAFAHSSSATFLASFSRPRLHKIFPLYRPHCLATRATATMSPKRIVTHNGTFHCDEVLAVHMLRHTKLYKDAAVVRSREEAVIAEADVVVDVGGVYDPDAQRFDHHQRGFTETFSSEGSRSRTKLSSAGLVYKHFGREIVRNILTTDEASATISEGDLDKVFMKVYDCFVEAVDAIDNGISMYDTDAPPRFESGTDLGSRVGHLNEAWNEPSTPEGQDENFSKAVAMAGPEFDSCVKRVASSWLPARSIVEKAMKARFIDDEAGRVLVMRDWAPWKDHLFTIEEEEAAANGKEQPVLYVVYKDMTGGSWRVQCVPVRKASFTSRAPLPAPWRGVRDESLSTLTGIDGCIFVHASGFIGGNKSFEGAMEMVRKSLTLT